MTTAGPPLAESTAATTGAAAIQRLVAPQPATAAPLLASASELSPTAGLDATPPPLDTDATAVESPRVALALAAPAVSSETSRHASSHRDSEAAQREPIHAAETRGIAVASSTSPTTAEPGPSAPPPAVATAVKTSVAAIRRSLEPGAEASATATPLRDPAVADVSSVGPDATSKPREADSITAVDSPRAVVPHATRTDSVRLSTDAGPAKPRSDRETATTTVAEQGPESSAPPEPALDRATQPVLEQTQRAHDEPPSPPRAAPPRRATLASAAAPHEPEPTVERRPRKRAVEPEPKPSVDRPLLHITIGRVEIHAPPSKTDSTSTRRKTPPLSLSDYLNRRR